MEPIDQPAEYSAERAVVRKQPLDYDVLGIGGADVAKFEALAEVQQSIDGSLSSVIKGLTNVQALASHMTSVQGSFVSLFEDYRKLTLASLKVEQDRDRLSDQYRDKSAEIENFRSDNAALRRELDGTRAGLIKSQGDLESFEKRNHILEIARREIEQKLAEVSSSAATASEIAESLRLELASLKQQVGQDASRISELSAKYHEAYEKSLLLSERCENYEATLKASYEQIAGLRGNIDSLSQERASLQSYAQQKDAETAQLRADFTKTFDKFQADLKGKERDIAEARSDNENYRSSARIYEQVNLELKFDNEAKASQIRHQEEMINKLELSINQLESKLGRVSADLDSTLAAKAQTDQSRAAISARVESVAQALRGREADVYRFENEVASLTTQLEEQGARSRNMIEALQSRVFELEKDLSAQKNETAYYYAQVELLKKPENRPAGMP